MNTIEAMERFFGLDQTELYPPKISTKQNAKAGEAFDMIMDRLDLMYCAEQDRIIIRQD